jgi:hypothetical protein
MLCGPLAREPDFSPGGCPDEGRALLQVLESEAPRRYQDSPAVVKQLQMRPGNTHPSLDQPSPLKVGDTFEDMQV